MLLAVAETTPELVVRSHVTVSSCEVVAIPMGSGVLGLILDSSRVSVKSELADVERGVWDALIIPMIEVLFSGVVVVAVGGLFSTIISGNGWSNTGGNFIAVGEGIGGGGRGVLACIWADAVIVQIRMEKMQWRMVFGWYC